MSGGGPALTAINTNVGSGIGGSAHVHTKLTPIETLQVGRRVRADAPTDDVDLQFGTEVIPSEWRKLTLTAPKRDGTVSDVVLLRPLWWIEQQQAKVDGTVFISVPECGIDGNATVHRIEACPEIVDGLGRVVTGTFRHQVSRGIELSVAGESQPIRCTGNHPFWSEDRQDFVRADSLQPGETLRTPTGLTTVVSTTTVPGQTFVYNLEVHGAHVYHVGTSGVLVHNGGGLPIIGGNCFTPIGDRLTINGLAGKIGERTAGIDQSLKQLVTHSSGRVRIPDELTSVGLREVKNVAKLSNTQQLRDFLDIADEMGVPFTLVIRKGTKLSQQLRDLQTQGRILIEYLEDYVP